MFGWVRNVLLRRPAPPYDERSTKAEHLERAEEQVRIQTARIKQLRAEAILAQSRFKS